MHLGRPAYLSMVGLTIGWALGLAGCGQGTGPALGDVSGTVTLDGKPLSDAMVSFYPQAGGRSAHGVTDGTGKYLLRFTGMKDGAMVGPHSVKVEVGVQTGEEEVRPVAKLPKLPAKYNTATELTAEVARGSNTIDFALQSK